MYFYHELDCRHFSWFTISYPICSNWLDLALQCPGHALLVIRSFESHLSFILHNSYMTFYGLELLNREGAVHKPQGSVGGKPNQHNVL